MDNKGKFHFTFKLLHFIAMGDLADLFTKTHMQTRDIPIICIIELPTSVIRF